MKGVGERAAKVNNTEGREKELMKVDLQIRKKFLTDKGAKVGRGEGIASVC